MAEHSSWTPYKDVGRAEEYQEALDALPQMGALLLAGGSGSRLRFDGPKGCFPIIEGKSLFQIFAEKVVAASERVGHPLRLAVMSSESHESVVARFFEERGRFGLEKDQLALFAQGTLPLLDENGETFLEAPGVEARGPNGNGLALHYFAKAGLLEEWQKAGIRHLNTVLVDNPLADPFDAKLLDYHLRQENEISLKCIDRLSPDEKVGVLVEIEGKLRVIEYSELPERSEKIPYANISLFCFTMDFVERVAPIVDLPLHRARKAARHLMPSGETVLSEGADYWKFEYFIFDLLVYARSCGALLYSRSEIFSPLKDRSSIPDVRAAILAI